MLKFKIINFFILITKTMSHILTIITFLIFLINWSFSDNISLIPLIQGQNILKEDIELPKDLKAELNFLIFSYKRNQSKITRLYSKNIFKTMFKYPIDIYNIPVLPSKMKFMLKPIMFSSLSSEISNKAVQERTLPIFVNVQKFMESLSIEDKDKIDILLVNKTGNIKWRSRYDNFDSNYITNIFKFLKN